MSYTSSTTNNRKQGNGTGIVTDYMESEQSTEGQLLFLEIK